MVGFTTLGERIREAMGIMQDDIPDIPDLEREIRDLINEPRKKHLLMRQGYLWIQLCTALDMIGDTQLAIDSFPISSAVKDYGALYLSIYGLLQACFLQQDAIKHLCEALGLEDSYKDHPRLVEIRELRNDAVGHPTKRNPKPPHRYCSISRISMSSVGFQMLTEEDGASEFGFISLPDVIADQRTFIRKLLASILAKLHRELQEHREQFKMEKLINCFPDTMGYAFEKLSQGVYESRPEMVAHAHMGLWGLSHIRNTLTCIQDALERRGLEVSSYPGIDAFYDEIQHPIDNLEAFLNAKKAGGEGPIDGKTASIFVSFLRAEMDKLKVMAREIDEDYGE